MAVSINNKNGTTTKVATNVKIVKQPANHFMTKAVYDPDGEVSQAGGIPEYVAGEIDGIESQKITGRYNVLDYGLKGDGITDNTTALISMLSEIPAGATIYFPSGTYNISDTITLSKAFNFVGDTQTVRRGDLGSTISYVGDKTNVAMFERGGVHQPQIGMAHLKFVGNAFEIVNNTDPFTTLPYPFFKENEIITGISCLKLGPDLEGNNDIKDCVFSGFSDCAVITSQNKFVKDCSFENCAIGIRVTFDCLVQNCFFNKCGSAIEIVKDSSHRVGGVSVSDCWADGLSRHFIESTNLSTAVTHVHQLTTSNVWVDMVDGSAFYFTGEIGFADISGIFGRIGMKYAGLQDADRTASKSVDSDFCCAKTIRNSAFNITVVPDDTIGQGNNPNGICTSRYLYSIEKYGISDVVINTPIIPFARLFDLNDDHNVLYRVNSTCKDGVCYNYEGATFINGTTSYSGSPIGHIRAGAVGYFCFDTVNKVMYRTTGTSKNDWEVITDLPTGGTTGQVLVKSSDADYDAEWGTVGDIELSKEIDTVGVFSRVIGNDATATEQSDGSVNVAQTSTSTNTVTFKVPIDVNKDNYITVTIKNSTMPTNMARIMIVGISPISIVSDFYIYTISEMKYTFKLSAEYLQTLGLSTFAEIGIGFSAVGEYNIAYTNKIGYSQDLSGLTETVHNMSMGTLTGKKCLFLGDSITALTGNRSWVENFLLRTGAVKVANVAVSGAQLNDYEDTVYDGDPKSSVQHNNTLGNQVQKIINNQYETPDLIIIAIGTNNGITADATRLSAAYTNYPPLADLDKTYSEGAFRYCNETLHNLYPDAKIIWCNPIPRAVSQNVISAYADALRTLTNWGSAYNIETNRCGIIAANEVSEHIYLQDGLHPNQWGAEKMAEYNAAAISQLFA